MTNETKILGIIGVVTIALIAGAVFFLSKGEKPVSVDSSLLVKEDSNVSTDSGKLTIVEFGDYQCPACAAAHGPLKQAISEHPGEIKFVFRHFPLAQHRNAEIAAQSVEAAKLQGKLWEMHDKLYESQGEWDEEANPLEFFKKYASGLGMDVDKFTADINSEASKQKVINDLADGTKLGVSSTPTLYFNSELYKGVISYENFKKEIEKYLNP